MITALETGGSILDRIIGRPEERKYRHLGFSEDGETGYREWGFNWRGHPSHQHSRSPGYVWTLYFRAGRLTDPGGHAQVAGF